MLFRFFLLSMYCLLRSTLRSTARVNEQGSNYLRKSSAKDNLDLETRDSFN